jgi:hypothetical protein
MALKQKFLIVWILGAMLAAFIASHALAIIRMSLENSCAFGIVPGIVLKLATLFWGNCN